MTSHNRIMIEITATEFKAKCLQLMDTVSQTGEIIQITKHGKPLVQLGPIPIEPQKTFKRGFAKGEFKIIGDILAPIDVEWDAMK